MSFKKGLVRFYDKHLHEDNKPKYIFKIYELEVGKEYLYDGCIYKINTDRVLYIKGKTDADFTSVVISYNDVIKYDFIEYEELNINWSKVKIDTRILYRDKVTNNWTKGYFAKFENGEVYVFANGCTSWTSKYDVENGFNNCILWKCICVKLYDER